MNTCRKWITVELILKILKDPVREDASDRIERRVFRKKVGDFKYGVVLIEENNGKEAHILTCFRND